MIQAYVDHFMNAKERVLADLKSKRPGGYEDLVKRLVTLLAEKQVDWKAPDIERIVKIDHGDYQGTLLFMIGAQGYQPSEYWYIFVSYGSCSGCDTFEAISNSSSTDVTDEEANQYWTLMLHMVQKMKAIGGYEEVV